MTDPLSLSLAGTAAVVAIAAGWLAVPRPPSLDAERWFKVILATLMRGEELPAVGSLLSDADSSDPKKPGRGNPEQDYPGGGIPDPEPIVS